MKSEKQKKWEKWLRNGKPAQHQLDCLKHKRTCVDCKKEVEGGFMLIRCPACRKIEHRRLALVRYHKIKHLKKG